MKPASVLAAVLLLTSTLARAFSPHDIASSKKAYVAGETVVGADGDVAKIQNGEVPDAEFDATAGRAATTLGLNKDEAMQAYELYKGRFAARREREQLLARLKDPKLPQNEKARLTARLDALASRLKWNPQDDGLPGGVAGKSGRALTQEELAQLSKQPRVNSNVKLDGTNAPPAMLGDLIKPPNNDGLINKFKNWVAPYVDGRAKAVKEMLSTVPSAEDRKSLDEAHDYVLANGGFAGKSPQDYWMVGQNEEKGFEPIVAINYAPMIGTAVGVTIPKNFVSLSDQGEKANISLDPKLKTAPIEVRALVIGHENQGHVDDIAHGFLNNEGSHIPSEVRAAVIDAYNYLAIRAKLTDERRNLLVRELIWQQADLKARIILEKKIPDNYKDRVVGNDASAIDSFRTKNPSAKASDVIREFVRMKYSNSGEEGMENLSLKDDSPIGKFNKSVDDLILNVQTEAGEKEWLKYDDPL